MRRSWRRSKPSARSSPSSRVRCSTLSDRVFTMPIAAMRALKPMSTEKIVTVAFEHLVDAGVHLGLRLLRREDHRADSDSIATANVVTRVTPITSPIVMRELRSGWRTAFSAASARRRTRPEQPPDEPERRRHHDVGAEDDAGERHDPADQADQHAERLRRGPTTTPSGQQPDPDHEQHERERRCAHGAVRAPRGPARASCRSPGSARTREHPARADPRREPGRERRRRPRAA